MSRVDVQTTQILRDIPPGAINFSVEDVYTPGPEPDVPTDKTRPKIMSSIESEEQYIYVLRKYGCFAIAYEPTSWGAMAPMIQPPMRFFGRHQWRIDGVERRAFTKNAQNLILSGAPGVGVTMPDSWSSFAEFTDYGVHKGDAEIVFQGKGNVGIKVDYGRFTGVTDLPVSPYDTIFYKTILSGYKISVTALADFIKKGGWK